MKRNIKQIISEMTLEEKAGMCSGFDFWHLKGVERLGIPSVMVSDGPHGLRKQDENADHLGINNSIKAVCFPAGCATASSFNRDLIYEMGEALGTECQAENVSVLLGPGANIKRSPLCGRNFEYFSEDPYLSSQMACNHIKGVQSKNIGTSFKHFLANNQEYRRMSCSSEIDERTLREIYLASFETAVKEAKPKTMMCSYNKINGILASENHRMLTEILRDEWGFEGYVMSDWGAVNNRVEGLKAGLDLEMPSNNGTNDEEIIDAVNNGTLNESILDTAVERILSQIFEFTDNRLNETFDLEKHHDLAARIEEESIILLKNNGVLPLDKDKKIAFVGTFAKTPRFQGGGSSHINSFKVSTPLDESQRFTTVTYAKGYSTETDVTDEVLLNEAVHLAKESDITVIFAGLPDSFESEGYDREHLNIPNCQNELIREINKVQKNVVVVLQNGSPIIMPWLNDVSAIVETYLGGQAVGEAVVNILFGEVNPSGKLAESFPLRLEDNPSYLTFKGDGKTVDYTEGIYVGYRYYDTKKMDVLFPFGYGLSYTTFEYSNLTVDSKTIKDTDKLTVTVDIKNTGSLLGKEVVQLYVRDLTNSASRPDKELKNFAKVELLPGEMKTVVMELDKRSFAWYNTQISDWYAASGQYELLIASSSRDIKLSKVITLISTTDIPFDIDDNTTIAELLSHPKTQEKANAFIQTYMHASSDEESSNEESKEAITPEMMIQMFMNSPLRSLRNFNGLSNKELRDMVREYQSLL